MKKQQEPIITEENLEYEDVRSANDMVRTNPDVKTIKQKKEVDFIGLFFKYLFILFLCYIVYLLGSSFINYGKDDDLLIEVVHECKCEENTELNRYRLYTSGVVEKVNTNGKSELSLGQVMLLNLYGKTVYRFAIDILAENTNDFYHISVYNSQGKVVKEYEGTEMFYNIPITKLVYTEEVEYLHLLGE